MKDNVQKIKKLIAELIGSSMAIDAKLDNLNNLLGSFNPIEHSDEIALVCDAGILLANKLQKNELIAQFFLIKAKSEVSKATFLIDETKNLKMALGWFGFALQSEKDRYDKLENGIQKIWINTQKCIDAGFTFLKKKPYVGVVGYCQRTAGEVLGSVYLQKVQYYFQPGKPGRAYIAQFKLIRFLDLDICILLDKESRKIVNNIKKDALRCFKEAIRAYKQEGKWDFLAECYISLGLEYHSFNSPIRSKIALHKAYGLIKKHKISGLTERWKSINEMPFIGSARELHD